MLRTYKTCNSAIGFAKYEFNNKLLNSTHIYIYIYEMGSNYTPSVTL